ncbi:hypothetical protein M0802_003059 [Mischocyttarus mexicanus]|nr:hypothetical protein M0802_003059 [Mischocyttarus mexicanus]
MIIQEVIPQKVKNNKEERSSNRDYLADRQRSFYDRDFGADLYVFEAYGGGCCYCDDGNDGVDDNYGCSGDGCNGCYGDSGDNSWKVAGD